MHGASGGLPRRTVQTKTLIRLTAFSEDEAWVYQFPPAEWPDAVRRIMSDCKREKLPDEAAGGLLELIAEGVSDEY